MNFCVICGYILAKTLYVEHGKREELIGSVSMSTKTIIPTKLQLVAKFIAT
jgi:hypothetical protein